MPAEYIVRVDLSKFTPELEAVPGGIEHLVQLVALEGWRNVSIESPVDHGRLASSWHVVRLTPLEYQIRSNVDYVEHVLRGHGVIVPVRAKALRFTPKGSNTFVFARRVGPVAPNPFIQRAVERTEGRIDALAAIALRGTGAG